MKVAFSLVVALCSWTLAFPPWLLEQGLDEDQMRVTSRIMDRLEQEKEPLSRRQMLPGLPREPVSTSGQHAFIPPGPNDQRGPCPGLNALANHGYLPRNGVGTILQFIDATTSVYNLGADVAAILSIYAAVMDGDDMSWSIGGPGQLGGLLGTPRGLSFSHNKNEGDASITRGDLYSVGNADKLHLPNFKLLYDSAGPNGYDFDTLAAHANKRHQHSEHTNPYFFAAPFSNLVSTGAYFFTTRMMSNSSSASSSSYLDAPILKSFFAIQGPDSASFVYTEGHERIPDSWFRRPDPYSLDKFVLDIVTSGLRYPRLRSIGGNTGSVDSFTPIDLANLTGGVFSTATLLQGNNLACFIYRLVQMASPDLLLDQRLQTILFRFLGDLIPSLNCPQLLSMDRSQLARFPGSKGF